ncbi:LytR/AlgR family response regulator transcription factor [Usitatibacter palustris]|uniref:Transcriptional regulatory protein YpdB n=1 Tax=Usitatibacter palustris TaxID=2732487 RepID=A0A6M4HB34_9PROT|nr:LytTR family DNA-binding domain-containing protein [Usitatibacter palustris]QJR16781.1 Transcriptional regulatory protein YpdB [Usitatibacter palustris]
MPTAIVAEDEPILRAQLEAKLKKLWPELEIIASVEDGAAALEALEDRTPDFMFLDIRMPEMTGVEVARHVGNRCHVIFVTAYDEYAVQAFETGAADYILKPATDERLAVTIERLKAKVSAHSPPTDLKSILAQIGEHVSGKKEKLQWIKANVGQNLRLIPVAEVLFFQSDEKYTRVVTADSEALIKTPIREILDGLDPEVFWQIHRSTVVNANAIAAVTRDFRGQAHVKIKGKDDNLVVSRIYSHLFKQM